MIVISWPNEDASGVAVVYEDEKCHKTWLEARGFVVGLYVPIGGSKPANASEWAFVMGCNSMDLPYDSRHFTPQCYERSNENISKRESVELKFCMERVRDVDHDLHHVAGDNYDIFSIVESDDSLRAAMMNCPSDRTIFVLWTNMDVKPKQNIPENVTMLKLSTPLPDKYISYIMRISKCYLALENNHHIASALCMKLPLMLRDAFILDWLGVCSPENTMYISKNWWGESAKHLLNSSYETYTTGIYKLKYSFSWPSFQENLSKIVEGYHETEEYDHANFRMSLLTRNNASQVKGEISSELSELSVCSEN